ncbi:MAG: GDSL-type esterase/lipase family protein [Bacteroidales bacterium]|nr:GDSL-type esterase/lipase family protein [Bacteroidales bacterium]
MDDIRNRAEAELPIEQQGAATAVEAQQTRNERNRWQRGYPFVAVFAAVAIVYALSFVPWGKLTGNYAKDYDLFADLFPKDSTAMVIASNEPIDPELIQEVAILSPNGQEAAALEEQTTAAEAQPVRTVPEYNPRVDGQMVIEDYTPDGRGLSRFKSALAGTGPARIAVIGDSYIEGDIFTQDLREQLQSRYGGRGVGYVPPHSMVAGFRRTVTMNGSGWSQHGIQKSNGGRFPNIAGEYFIAPGAASVTYKGNPKDERLSSWSSSRLLFVAPDSGKITLTTDKETVTYDVVPTQEVQALTVPGETTSFSVESKVPGLAFLGAWLEDNGGVVVDCMSMRGVSGVAHRKINSELASEMRKYVDYDLIIVEYGINALTADQDNYYGYGKLMSQVIGKLRECYPKADILMMGIGDRGQKVDGQVHSIPTAGAMVKAQRKTAQDTGCLFWDTREAMGGYDAIVDWREKRLVNGDYIHLNSAGGKVLAQELVSSMLRLME